MDKIETPKIALRSISSLFNDAWNLYKERWSVLLEIVLLPALVVILGSVILVIDLGTLFRVFGGVVIIVGWIAFVYSVLPVIYSVHHGTGVDASYKATIGWLWSYVWVAILQILAFVGASFMLIIPGIWMGIALALTSYAFVIEGRRGIDALRQSKDYIKGYWWAVLGRTLLLSLVYIVASIIVRIPITIVAGPVAGAFVSALLVVFFVPFSAIYSYMIFQNLRTLKPALAEAQTKEGTGFIKTSAIVGIAAPILLIILGIVLAVAGVFSMIGHTNFHYVPQSGGYYGQMPPIQQ